jgi:hypothetical protein
VYEQLPRVPPAVFRWIPQLDFLEESPRSLERHHVPSGAPVSSEASFQEWVCTEGYMPRKATPL